LKILFTNNTLDRRAGTELYTLDLARRLLARGHRPIAFTTDLGPVAEELRKATIPVIDDPAKLAEPPDVIHAQHHLEALIALLSFPGVPAVFVCHGWLPWEETPLVFPRIARYVAIDEPCRDRLELEAGIAHDKIELFLSFVDLARFRPRPSLPARPARALVFSNQASEATFLPAVREACSQRGIELDVAGWAAGKVADRPEEMLPAYDLVFAKARCALEALAVGSAVILCDQSGAGPLVTSAELDRLRPLNFGVRTLANPASADLLGREIDRYDAADAARVSERIRAEAGLEATVDRYVDLYERILAESRSRTSSAEEEGRAAAAYLLWVRRQIPEGRKLKSELTHLGSELAPLKSALAQRESAITYLKGELARLEGTATWKLRERLVGIGPLRSLYRWLRR
jgi:hypothetical protein